jgi:hypothetical protein
VSNHSSPRQAPVIGVNHHDVVGVHSVVDPWGTKSRHSWRIAYRDPIEVALIDKLAWSDINLLRSGSDQAAPYRFCTFAPVVTLPGSNQAVLLVPWVLSRCAAAALVAGGSQPPRLSIAKAIMASGDLKPKAIRVKRRTLVFVLSTSPLDSRCGPLSR